MKFKSMLNLDVENDEKILLFDVETTGLNPEKHAVITISGAIIINGVIKNWFDFKCRPLDTDEIDDYALEVNGYTKEEIMTWEHPKETLGKLFEMLEGYVKPRENKNNIRNRFNPMGYNVPFDINMLSEMVKKSGFRPNAQKKYDILGALLNRGMSIDVHKIVTVLELIKPKMFLSSHKLSTVAEKLNIPIKAHDSLSDCRATWEIWVWCLYRMKQVGNYMSLKGMGWY